MAEGRTDGDENKAKTKHGLNLCLAATLAFTFPDQNLPLPREDRYISQDFFLSTIEELLAKNRHLSVTAHIINRQPSERFNTNGFFDPEGHHFKIYGQADESAFSEALKDCSKAWLTFFPKEQPQAEADAFHTVGLIKSVNNQFRVRDTRNFFAGRADSTAIFATVSQTMHPDSPVIIHAFS